MPNSEEHIFSPYFEFIWFLSIITFERCRYFNLVTQGPIFLIETGSP